MQEKQKKCHIRLLSTAPPLPQKRKQNYAQSFGKFFAYCSFPKNSGNVTQNLRKTLTVYTKLSVSQCWAKNARKEKNATQDCFQVNLFYVKCKKKTKIHATFKVKFTAKKQKMRISPHFLQLIENYFVFFCTQKVCTAFCRVS